MSRWKRNSALPDRIADPVLGIVSFECALDGMDEYQAKVKLGGRRVSIDLYTDENGELQPCIVRARKIVERFPAIQQKMRRYIEKNIFPTFNEEWRPDQKPISLEQIMSKLKLTQISTSPKPEATFWFDARDLFHYHVLQLNMGERNKIVSYDTPG